MNQLPLFKLASFGQKDLVWHEQVRSDVKKTTIFYLSEFCSTEMARPWALPVYKSGDTYAFRQPKLLKKTISGQIVHSNGFRRVRISEALALQPFSKTTIHTKTDLSWRTNFNLSSPSCKRWRLQILKLLISICSLNHPWDSHRSLWRHSRSSLPKISENTMNRTRMDSSGERVRRQVASTTVHWFVRFQAYSNPKAEEYWKPLL